MKIESLSFLTELTDEDASCVNGGSIFIAFPPRIPTPIGIRPPKWRFPVIPKRPRDGFIKLL